MLVRWAEGHDHGLVWEHGFAVLRSETPAASADLLWTAFVAGGDVPAFVRLLGASAGADVLALPAFALVLRTADGWRVAARGDLTVSVDGELVVGLGISTWAERTFSDARRLSVGDVAGPGAGRPVTGGVVATSGLAWEDAVVASGTPGGATAARGAGAVSASVEAFVESPAPDAVASVVVDAEPEPEPAEPEPAEPEPEPEPAEPEPAEPPVPVSPVEPPVAVPRSPSEQDPGQVTWLPDAEASPAADEPVLIDVPAGASSPAAAPGRFAIQFGDTRLGSVQDAAVRQGEPEFIAAVPGAARPADEPADDDLDGDHDGYTMLVEDAPAPIAGLEPVDDPAGGATVLGVLCARGHANPPSRAACSLCGEAITGEPRRVSRPALGRVRLPNGERIELDAPVIVGRNPRADRVQGSTLPHMVPLSQGHISGTHLELRLEEWNVLAVDLHSTNGTFLRRHGEAPVRLGERPEVLIEGDVLDLGHGVQLTLESLR